MDHKTTTRALDGNMDDSSHIRYISPRFLLIAALVITVVIASRSVIAAEIQLSSIGIVTLSGEIQRGDAHQFKQILMTEFNEFVSHIQRLESDKNYLQDYTARDTYNLNLQLPVTGVTLNSPGGDLAEAIQISEIVETFLLDTLVTGNHECHSACTFIYIAGVNRYGYGKIGLHRPRLSKQYFANLELKEAQNQYSKLLEESANWLTKRYVSRELIDIMLRTASKDMYILKLKEIPHKSPVIAEWLGAKCEMLSDAEQTAYNSSLLIHGGKDTIEQAHVILIEHGYTNRGAWEKIFKNKSLYKQEYGEPYLKEIYTKGQEITSCETETLNAEQMKRMANSDNWKN